MVSLLFVPASSVMAEDIYYDGSNTSMLATDPAQSEPNSLFPVSSLSGNNVTVNSASIAGYVLGGVTTSGTSVSNNTVTLDASTVGRSYGGYSTSGNVTANSVNMTGNASTSVVYGGNTDTGNAQGNKVTLTGSNGNMVFGGYTNTGTASGNVSELTGGSISSTMSAGRSDTGTVQGNTSIVSGGSTVTVLYGGWLTTSGTADSNAVIVTDSTVRTRLYGAHTDSTGIVSNNTVTITNSLVSSGTNSQSMVYGGHSLGNAEVKNNTVVLKNSTVGNSVYGGRSEAQSAPVTATTGATGNTVIIQDSRVGLSQASSAYGGFSSNGKAENNTVTIMGNSLVDRNLIGGYIENGTATNNTVNLQGGAVNGDVWGGYSLFPATATDVFTGNTLNVNTRFNVGGTLGNFENLNFTLPVDMQANPGDAVITAGGLSLGGASTVKSINILPGTTPFKAGDTINLITSGSATSGSLANNSIQSKQGLSLLYDWDLNLTANALTASLANATVNPQSRSLLLGRLDEMALLKQGGDLLAGQALENMIASSRDCYKGFFAMQGGTSKYKTDPDFTLDSFNALVGLSCAVKLKSGTDLSGGAFLEIGTGSYKGDHDFTEVGAIKTNGNVNYFGGGVLGEANFNNGFAIDGALRIGRIKSDFKSDYYYNGQRASYDDTSSTYYGAHISGVYKWAISDQDSVNTYARYSWAHINSDNVTVLSDPYHFDSITSSRVRVGAKYARNTKTFMPYAGLAYEYEFDGKEGGTVYGYRMKDLDLGGSTVVAELGMSWLPTANDNLRLNVALEGFLGNREGVMGSFRLNYRF